MEKVSLKGDVFVATGNKGKLKEIIPMIEEYFDVDGQISGYSPDDVEENAPSLEGNALIKAHHVKNELICSNKSHFWVLADDSGLCVDQLDGAPGIYSARYAGDHVDANAHMRKLIHSLQHFSAPHKAHYTCALALVSHLDHEHIGLGHCHGEIIHDARGESGFGYDPIFYAPEHQKTFAQISYETKNAISHRRRAFEELQKIMRDAN